MYGIILSRGEYMERLEIRLSKELKEKFKRKCKKMVTTPSDELRRYIAKLIDDNNKMHMQVMSDPENQPNQFCPQESCMTVIELKESIRELHALSGKLADMISQPTHCEFEALYAIQELIKIQIKKHKIL